MSVATLTRPVLEPAAEAFAKATSSPPFLPDLGPIEGRKAVDEVQSGTLAKPQVDEEWITVSGGPTGAVQLRLSGPLTPRGPCR